jgi:hypothetical protein
MCVHTQKHISKTKNSNLAEDEQRVKWVVEEHKE